MQLWLRTNVFSAVLPSCYKISPGSTCARQQGNGATESKRSTSFCYYYEKPLAFILQGTGSLFVMNGRPLLMPTNGPCCSVDKAALISCPRPWLCHCMGAAPAVVGRGPGGSFPSAGGPVATADKEL